MDADAVRDRLGVTRRRLEIQGLLGLADRDIAAWGRWVQFPYALCGAIVALGTLLGSPAVLWSLMPFAALGAAQRVHPFDRLYNRWLRRYTGTPPLPKRGAPTRFACGVGAVWLLLQGLAFASDLALPGYAMGAVMVAFQGLVATTHICLPSIAYGRLFGFPSTTAAAKPGPHARPAPR